MANKKKKNPALLFAGRIAFFIIALGILVYIALYSSGIGEYLKFSIVGQDITKEMIIIIGIMAGLIGSLLLKESIGAA